MIKNIPRIIGPRKVFNDVYESDILKQKRAAINGRLFYAEIETIVTESNYIVTCFLLDSEIGKKKHPLELSKALVYRMIITNTDIGHFVKFDGYKRIYEDNEIPRIEYTFNIQP